MGKHTPGPWEVVSKTTYTTVEPGISEPEDDWLEVRGGDESLVCTLDGGAVYDAELIAAAPELLEALKEIAKGEGAFSWTRLTFANNTIENMRDIANVAIAKTEGES